MSPNLDSTSPVNLLNVLKDDIAVISMTHKLITRHPRTGYHNQPWIEWYMPTLNRYPNRVAVQDTQQSVKRNIARSEVIQNDSILAIVTVKPRQYVRDPHRPVKPKLKCSSSLATTSWTSQPHNLRHKLRNISKSKRIQLLNPTSVTTKQLSCLA